MSEVYYQIRDLNRVGGIKFRGILDYVVVFYCICMYRCIYRLQDTEREFFLFF